MAEIFYSGEETGQVTVRQGETKRALDPRFDLHKHSPSGFGAKAMLGLHSSRLQCSPTPSKATSARSSCIIVSVVALFRFLLSDGRSRGAAFSPMST